MARFDPQGLGLGLLAGGLMLGTALAMTTPTRMKLPPAPPWRIASGEQASAQPADDATNSTPWFTASTYEILPAMRHVPTFSGDAVPPAEARLADSYADDSHWQQIAADAPDAAEDESEILAPEDDEPAATPREEDVAADLAEEGDDSPLSPA